MSDDKARRDSHAANHESQYNRAHCAATARRDPRTRRRRRGVRLGDILPCSSSCADGVRRRCSRERRPLARLHSAAAQLPHLLEMREEEAESRKPKPEASTGQVR